MYLPDGLAAAARDSGLQISTLAQSAVQAALAGRSTTAWLTTLATLPSVAIPHERVIDALDGTRDDPPGSHA